MPRRTPFGHRQGTMVNGVWTISPNVVLTLAALAAVDATERTEGDIVTLGDGTQWVYNPASTVTEPTQNLVVVPSDNVGRWLRVNDTLDISIPVTFNTADAAAIFTVPTGCRLHIRRGYWEVTTGFTGGASSAIGLSSSNAAFNTKGDLLGGATGDVAATLVAGVVPGTIGAKTAAGIILVAGNTVRFDRITSAFTAGAGNAHLIADLLVNSGV